MSEPAAPRVLVVDDHEAGRYVTARVLSRAGYQVSEAATGMEALRLAQGGQDLVVLDVNLPDLSGFEVLARLRGDHGTTGVPVLMVSASYLSDAHRVQGLEEGADAYLTHPIEPGVLLATARALLRIRRAESQLRELNRDLERLVGERTAQLAERNAQLEAEKAALAEQQRRLEQANEDLEAFAYSVSHDLRTPVRHISSFAGLLRRRVAPGPDAQALKFVDTIEHAAARMDTLIEALLAFSRFGRAELRLDPVDLSALVDEARVELAVEVGERRVEWVVRPLPVVRGDERLLRLVFANLLGNAVKFTQPCEVACIEVWAEEAPGLATLHVRDNGAGFDPRYAHRLFGVFQRLHRDVDFQGTGVGLANVKRIVQRHGGQVWAQGRPGEGATFSFSLPLQGRA